ncbi:MAG: hypothetical protein M3R02_22080 [Chloroflexota bacterium]|nr:hypothetical protein [Chloroflexota bacterium]
MANGTPVPCRRGHGADAGLDDPADPRAQALAERWNALTERTTRHYQQHPELLEAVRANYERGAFEGTGRAPQQADFAFIERIKAARPGTADSVEPR